MRGIQPPADAAPFCIALGFDGCRDREDEVRRAVYRYVLR